MDHNRRTFLTASAAAVLGGSLVSPASTQVVSARDQAGAKTGSGKLILRYKPYELKLRHTFTVATYSRTTTPNVQVELEYDGVVGYGEASLPQYLGESVASVLAFLERVDLSGFSSPFETEEILARVDAITENNTAAKASIDIALHDLIGKLLGAPWYRIWGLNPARIPPTVYTIGIDKPDIVRQKTLEAAGRFKILKVKLGRDNDREMIETIRSVSDLPLAVDVNQGWTERYQALDMLHWLKEKGVVLVEQPLSKRRLEDNGWLTERSPIPIFADESMQRLDDVMKMKDYFSGINIKLMKCTGMREAWKMVQLARACNMKVMIGCMVETSCAIAAAVQLSPAADFLDLDGNLLITNDPFEGVELVNGCQMPSNRPGLGIRKKDLPSE